MSQLVTEVRVVLLARVPNALVGIDVVVAGVGGLIVADIVEDVELRLGSPIADIRNPGALQVESLPFRAT